MFLDDTDEKIMAALPNAGAEPIDVREVHRRVDCWALSSIRRSLIEMEKRGEVQSILLPHRQGFIRLFKRQQQALTAAE